MKIVSSFFIYLGMGVLANSLHAADLQRVGQGFSNPLFATAPANDTSQLFVVEKGGAIKILNLMTGVTNPTPFLTVPNINTAGEGGLLGLAFHPNYAVNGKFYVDVINPAGDTEVREYTVSSNASIADSGSGRVVLSVDQPAGRTNHKAGWIGFHPTNGHLYIATGDGGGGDDPDNFAQNKNSLLGKMLRVSVNTSAIGPIYSIPTDNPFALSGGAAEVWAYGLRNPFRNSFDRDTGDLYIGDVGQSAREEIDFHKSGTPGGSNYGWRAREGTLDNTSVADPAPVGALDPIYDYGRGNGAFLGETVTGGYVYRGSLAPELEGKYFFGDFIDGHIWSFNYDPNASLLTGLTNWDSILTPDFGTLGNISSFGEGGTGELFLVGYGGDVFLIIPEPSSTALLGVALLLMMGILWRRRAIGQRG